MWWSALVGALIGGALAQVAQLISHRLASERDQSAAMRKAAASLLGDGRMMQDVLLRAMAARGRRPDDAAEADDIDRKALETILPRFVASHYELRWTAPDDVQLAVQDFVEELNTLMNMWRRPRPAVLAQSHRMANAANRLDKLIGLHFGVPLPYEVQDVPELSSQSDNDMSADD